MKKYGLPSFVANYLIYRLRANGKHKVHSPFVYDVYTKAILGRTKWDRSAIDRIIAERKSQDIPLVYQHPDSAVGQVATSISQLASVPAKSRKYQNLLHRLTRHHNVQHGLEIGTSLGFSTMAMASARPDAQWISLEGVEEIATLARENFAKAKLENIELITGHFDKTLPAFLKDCPALDLVFFDGNHQYEPTMSYFEQCLKKRSKSAVFIFDDINWSPEMQMAWEGIKSHPETTTTIDLYVCGLAYFDRSRSKEHFLLRF